VSDAALPVVDVAPLVARRRAAARGSGVAPDRDFLAAAREIGAACRASGFFYAAGHGVDPELERRLEDLAAEFFARSAERKLAIRMERGGRAWRGYFPVGGELTSGKPDRKEGLYFGAELRPDDPRVRAGTPLHGPNLFPDDAPEWRAAVLGYIAQMTELGHAIVAGIGASLGLPDSFFAERYTRDPLVLFRIFHYPPRPDDGGWGVGEHTDYGLLSIVKQDATGGLEVRVGARWIDAPPIAGAFVCNVGDMLDRMTAGRYRSTPHRVRVPRERGRLSFPFFFDPGFDAEVRPIELADGWVVPEDRAERWDGTSLRDLRGTYGDYLLGKVARVFPALGRDVLDQAPSRAR